MWEGSVERNCGPMNKNRIEGAANQGERAQDREALVIEGRRRKSGGRAVKECVLTWGDLALRRKGRRRRAGARSQRSGLAGDEVKPSLPQTAMKTDARALKQGAQG